MSGERPAPSPAPSPESIPSEELSITEQVDAHARSLEQGLQSQPEVADNDNEHQTAPARGEAKVTLKGSQHLDQLVLDGIDFAQRNVTEKINEKMEDVTFSAKDKYFGWRVNSTRDSLAKAKESLAATPKSGPIANRLRRGRARKVRKLERRLQGLSGLHSQIVGEHGIATERAKDDKGNELGISRVREARQGIYQRRINDMLKAEKGYYEKTQLDRQVGEAAKEGGADISNVSYYDFVGLGRKQQRKRQNEAKHPDASPSRVRELKSLIRETNSVEKLEALGREEFLRRLAKAAVKDVARASINHYASRFDAGSDAKKAA